MGNFKLALSKFLPGASYLTFVLQLQGDIIVMDIHGNSVGKANLRPGVPISEMVWNCERFNMEEPVEPASVMNVNNIFPNNVHPPKDPKPYQRSDGEYTDLGSLIGNTQCGNFRFFCHLDFM